MFLSLATARARVCYFPVSFSPLPRDIGAEKRILSATEKPFCLLMGQRESLFTGRRAGRCDRLAPPPGIIYERLTARAAPYGGFGNVRAPTVPSARPSARRRFPPRRPGSAETREIRTAAMRGTGENGNLFTSAGFILYIYIFLYFLFFSFCRTQRPCRRRILIVADDCARPPSATIRPRRRRVVT